MWAGVRVVGVRIEYITYLCTKITIDSQSAMTSGCLEQTEGSYVKKVCACRSYAGQVPCNSVSHPITNTIILLVTAITILYDFIVTLSSKVRLFSWANASQCVKSSYRIILQDTMEPAFTTGSKGTPSFRGERRPDVVQGVEWVETITLLEKKNMPTLRQLGYVPTKSSLKLMAGYGLDNKKTNRLLCVRASPTSLLDLEVISEFASLSRSLSYWHVKGRTEGDEQT
ncbi:unnamed protein product [Timema podura]|uniref:Uncharacterized protein n=1 Tax=Timema podura TaxID=61482 RepID=A0ABN7ND08_TIMPD|nr:unnamed protein product [Timema podura]